jgi:hypothetical protein
MGDDENAGAVVHRIAYPPPPAVGPAVSHAHDHHGALGGDGGHLARHKHVMAAVVGAGFAPVSSVLECGVVIKEIPPMTVGPLRVAPQMPFHIRVVAVSQIDYGHDHVR